MPYFKDQVIADLETAGIVLRKGPDYPNGFVLKSGKKSDIYINLRDVIKRPVAFNYLVYCMYDMITSVYDKEGSCVIGIPTMGSVFSPVLAYKLGLPQAVIRQHKKNHGVGNELEGQLSNRIMLIDDVITTGTSVKEIIQDYIEPVFDQEYELDIFVVVDREQHGLDNVHSLATLSDIKKYKPSKVTDDFVYGANIGSR